MLVALDTLLKMLIVRLLIHLTLQIDSVHLCSLSPSTLQSKEVKLKIKTGNIYFAVQSQFSSGVHILQATCC